MGLLLSLFSGTPRLSSNRVCDPWYPLSSHTKTNAGVRVTPDSALKVSAVMACVKVLSETMSSLPLKVYKRLPDGGKQEASDYPLYEVLHCKPNGWQTIFEFTEMMQSHLCLRGNAYAVKVPGILGAVTQLVPVDPDLVTVEVNRESGRIFYKIRHNPAEPAETYNQDEVLHIRHMTLDGYLGISPIQYAREAIGLAAASEEYGSSLFANAGIPKIALTTDANLTNDQRSQLGKSWGDAHAGEGNHNKTAVLSNGLKIQQLTITPEDAQFLETRKYQSEDIARVFRVPLHLIGNLDRSTNNNIEHQSREFLTYTMLPWVRRWECAINRSLIDTSTGNYFAEFCVEGLLRGDVQSRARWYESMRNMGCYSANEIRAKENENPIGPEGEKRFVNAALVDLTKAGDPAAMGQSPSQPPSEGKNNKPKGGKLSKKLSKASLKAVLLLSDELGGLLRWEANETKRIASDPGKFLAKLDKFQAEHAERMAEKLNPFCELLNSLNSVASIGCDAAIQLHFEESKALLLSACECSAEELPGKVSDLVAKWPESRKEGFLKCLSL